MKKKLKIITVSLLLFCLLFVGAASAATETERVVNGDFSVNLYGWDTSGTTSGSSVVIDNGACLLSAVIPGPQGTLSDGFARISQQIDLTDVQTLTWKSKQKQYGIGVQNSYVLNIYDGTRLVADYRWVDIGHPDFTQQSYNVASLSGTHTVVFEVLAFGSYAGGQVQIYLDDISAKAITADPVLNAAHLQKNGVSVGENTVFVQGTDTISVIYTATDSIPPGSYVRVFWGDDKFDSPAGMTGTVSHTYTSLGVYQPFVQIYTPSGVWISTTNLPSVYLVSAEISAYPTSLDVGGETQFTLTYTGTDSIAGYSWSFGTSATPQTSTQSAPIVRYNSAGSFGASVTITTTSGMTFTVSRQNLINVATQSVTFSQTQAESGDTATVSWSLRDPVYPYQLNIYPSYNNGERSSYTAVQQHTISSASDTPYTFTTGSAGYYTAYIEKSGAVVVRTTTPLNVVTLISLTVNVLDNGAPYLTEASTVKLYKSDSTLVSTLTTSTTSNTVTFNDIETGDYYVTIEADGKTMRTSPSLVLTDSFTLNIDYTFGSSETSSAGVGSQYATTFVTFRCQDSGTGRYLQGVQIIAEAVQPTNAWEYFANLFGSALGTVVQSMTLSGSSDMDGRITFAMYQNVRYNLNITYISGSFRYQENRPFQQSSLSGEYLIDIPVTNTEPVVAIDKIHCGVTAENEIITFNFTDDSGTVSVCNVKVYEKTDEGRKDTNMSIMFTGPQQGTVYTQQFSPPDAGGKSYIVSFEVSSSLYGNKKFEYGVTFPGVLIKLGDIPNSWYIWISFAILLMLGGVATFVNSRHFAIVICVVATLLYFAGWLNALGSIALVALIICYVLSIVYYIANRDTGGV